MNQHPRPKVEIGKNTFVTLKEDTHQYFDTDGAEYRSISSILGKVKPAFDREGQSRRSAKGNLPDGASEQQIQAEQKRLLDSWDDMRISSTDWGTYVHDNLEKYFTVGTCDAQVLKAALSIGQYLSYAKRVFPEEIYYDPARFIAGTADHSVIRKMGRKPETTILDIYDYKTNERKGIEFDSSYIDKHGDWKPGGKYMLPPLDHLEHCNFNTYSLQISCYAYMAELMYGYKIGRLGILFIDKEMNVTLLPVFYLRHETYPKRHSCSCPYLKFQQILKWLSTLMQLSSFRNSDL